MSRYTTSVNLGLLDVVHHVFAARDTHLVPADIPDPPPAWVAEYPRLAEDLTYASPGLFSALDLLRAFWRRTQAGNGTV
ncbi:hypothetical protein [Nonomuraea sp. B1E8]|uniref:hypothetical protein n=1 Tax=unclassified Nonomuraea TaxID=2593643 RepID=UPI00325EBE96